MFGFKTLESEFLHRIPHPQYQIQISLSLFLQMFQQEWWLIVKTGCVKDQQKKKHVLWQRHLKYILWKRTLKEIWIKEMKQDAIKLILNRIEFILFEVFCNTGTTGSALSSKIIVYIVFASAKIKTSFYFFSERGGVRLKLCLYRWIVVKQK